MNEKEKTFSILFILILLLVIAKVYTQNRLVPDDAQLARYEEEASRVKADNIILKSQILERESYNTINRRAREDGFIEASYIVLDGR